MSKLSKVLVFVLALTLVISALAVTTFAVDDKTDGATVYLTPNDSWMADGARFAILATGSQGEVWVDMTAVGNSMIYVGQVPAGYTNITFCRLSSADSTNEWANRLNNTSDMPIPETNNLYTLDDDATLGSVGSWSRLEAIVDTQVDNHKAACNCPDCNVPYASAADALANVKDGDQVYLCANVSGNLSVNKAVNVDGLVVDGTKVATVYGKLNVTGNGATVKNIDVVNPSANGVYISGSDITLENCDVIGSNALRSCYAKGLVTLKNCVLTGDTYGVHFDGNDGGEIVIDGCTITGWTSFAKTIKKVTISNTSFEEGNYNYIRFYQEDVTLENCSFNELMKIDIADGVIADVKIDGSELENGQIKELFDEYDLRDSTVVVDGTEVPSPFLKGAGTEEDPYLIYTYEDLMFFKYKVNKGEEIYNLPTVWVALAADIDFEGRVWTDGIGDGHNWSFDGNFDGKGYTIKNFTMTPYVDDAGYICGGFFGYIYGAVTIKNVNFENVTVDAGDLAGHNVGVVAGFAYKCNGAVIENVNVYGDVKLNAPYGEGVGVILGYSYANGVEIKNCTVDANDGSYINGKNFVGGITGYSYTDSKFDGCKVNNLEITGTNYVGGITGLANNNTSVNGCVVTDTTVSGDKCVASVVGSIGSNGGNLVLDNCDASYPVVGGEWKSQENLVCKIGNKYYISVNDAMAAAKAGDTVTLISDVTLPADNVAFDDGNGLSTHTAILLPEGITFDGGNFTLTVTPVEGVSTWGSAVCVTGGTLKNLTIVGGNRGVLINRPTCDIVIDNVSVSHSTYALNSNAMGVNGAVKVTVTNSTFNGWISLSNVSLTGAEFVNCSLGWSNRGEDKTDYAYMRPYCAVSFANCDFAEGYEVDTTYTTPKFEGCSVNGETITVYNVGSVSAGAAAIVIDGVITTYNTLADAVAVGGEIVVIRNVELTEKLVIPANAVILLDFNGFVISGVSPEAKATAVVENLGSLTIMSSTEGGKITSQALTPDTNWGGEGQLAFPSYANNTIANKGTLVLESGTIENTSPAGGATYAIDNYAGTITVNGGKIYCENNIAVRLFANNQDMGITVNGGELDGVRAIWVQLPSSNASIAPKVDVVVTDGILSGRMTDKGYYLAIYSYSYGNGLQNVSFDISGGTFNGDIALAGGENKTHSETVNITGGTFNGEVYSYAEDSVAVPAITISGGVYQSNDAEKYAFDDGFRFVANINGRYGVVNSDSNLNIKDIDGVKYWFFGDFNTEVVAVIETEVLVQPCLKAERDEEGVAYVYISIDGENWDKLVKLSDFLPDVDTTVTPKFEVKADENGNSYIYVSYDDGDTWEKTEILVGEKKDEPCDGVDTPAVGFSKIFIIVCIAVTGISVVVCIIALASRKKKRKSWWFN